jgi:hypothetical protein
MAEDIQQGSKVNKSVQKEGAAGTRVDPYPYLGIVKNNVDPTRAGRLQVWIADFGGNADEPGNWRTVSYASPFIGTTNIPINGSKTNSWSESPQTYGMWMTPPDIGVEVLVIFVSGDPQKGYWIACVSSNISRYMLPGNASSLYPSTEFSSDAVKKTYNAAVADNGGVVPAPVTEFNSNLKEYATDPGFINIGKPIHEPQYLILTGQGLDRDPYRGVLTSSSQRETPSNVFGISTPGRPLNDPVLDPGYEAKVKSGNLTEADYAVKTRVGGHTFIMDDGDSTDKNKLIRIRSSSGHQIVLNDSANSLYISNNKGTVWVEFTDEGKLNFFSAGGIDVRTQGDMNFHADGNINFNAVGKFNIKAEDKAHIDCKSIDMNANEGLVIGTTGKTEFNSAGCFNIDCSAKVSVKAAGDMILVGATIKQNNGGAATVAAPIPIPVNQLIDTSLSSDGIWIQKEKALRTIVAFAPSHEPSYRKSMSKIVSAPAPADPSKGVPPKASGPQDKSTDAKGNFTGAAGTPVSNPITSTDIRKQPLSTSEVGSMSKEHVTSLFAQIGKTQ